jgi:hypothetical protein
VEEVEVVQLVVAWGMEQDCEELYGSDVEVEQPLEAMQLPVLQMHLEDHCLVEELEAQLPEEEVEVEAEAVQLAELVVGAVESGMEQRSEQLDGSDNDVEEPLEAMQLPVLPMNLEHNGLVEAEE